MILHVAIGAAGGLVLAGLGALLVVRVHRGRAARIAVARALEALITDEVAAVRWRFRSDVWAPDDWIEPPDPVAAAALVRELRERAFTPTYEIHPGGSAHGCERCGRTAA